MALRFTDALSVSGPRYAYDKEVGRRITECRDTFRSNCIGTALYIVGLQESDTAVCTFKAYADYTGKMQRTKYPEEGCIVAWEISFKLFGDIATPHMGIVSSVRPLLVTNRYSANGPFIENEPFENAGKPYQNIPISFYLAPEMAHMLELRRLD